MSELIRGFTGHHGPVLKRDEWLTPPEIIREFGPFDLDPCAAPEPRPWPTADIHYTLKEDGDGLLRPWDIIRCTKCGLVKPHENSTESSDLSRDGPVEHRPGVYTMFSHEGGGNAAGLVPGQASPCPRCGETGIVERARVWLNPSYGKHTGRWLDRMASHGDGIALVFARTETQMFHECVFKRASGILFLRGRLTFHNLDGTVPKANAGAPSVLIAYDSRTSGENWRRLRDGRVDGRFVRLHQMEFEEERVLERLVKFPDGHEEIANELGVGIVRLRKIERSALIKRGEIPEVWS